MKFPTASLKSLLLITLTIGGALQANAASSVKISGKINGLTESGYQLLFVTSGGLIQKSASIGTNGRFTLKGLPKTSLKNGSLQLIKSGTYVGPVVLKAKGTKAYIFLSGKMAANLGTTINLGTINLKDGYALVKKLVDVTVTNSKSAAHSIAGVPIGAGKLGYVASASSSQGNAGQDDDRDGIVNVFDVDVDGDLLANSFDVGDGAAPAALKRNAAEGQRLDAPFTTLYLDMNHTLNLNIGSVTRSQIDANLSGSGSFAIVYFFNVQDSAYTGAHVKCDSSLLYCRSAADGGSTATVGGVSESTSPPSGLWSDFNDDGSGYPNLDLISNFRSGGENVFVASVNPGVGTSGFKPGDVATLEFMTGGTVSQTRPMFIPSYFVTVPAMSSYDVGAGVQSISYSSPPGTGSGSPLVVPSGENLTVTFWRPQRLTLGAESGEFRDIAALHYGLVISTMSQEFGCSADYYTGLDSLAPDGEQNLWPLIDTATADLETSASNTLRLTVDLRACLQANGATLGQPYSISLTAAGAQESGGNDRAAQNFFVQVDP